MSNKGNYFISNLKNSMCRSFCKEGRHGIMESLKEKCKFLYLVQFPGVGEYKMPSDFGIYESSHKN
jgi:hypothetical protein